MQIFVALAIGCVIMAYQQRGYIMIEVIFVLFLLALALGMGFAYLGYEWGEISYRDAISPVSLPIALFTCYRCTKTGKFVKKPYFHRDATHLHATIKI